MVTAPEPLDSSEEQNTPALLSRLLAGDREAANLLFRVHYERLRRAIRPYFRREHRNALDEEDLLQQTLFRALLSLDQFESRGKGAFLAWLKQIALNELRTELKPRSRASACDPPTERIGEGPRLLERIPSREPTPSDILERREENLLLEEAIHSLAEDERDLIVNRQILGQDYASLAAALGITEGAVRMKVSRAMNRIARWIEGNS